MQKLVVQEIEEIIENKIDAKKDILATKEDIGVLKQELLKLHVEVASKFNSIIMWLVGTGIGIVGLIFTIIKLFVIK